MPTNATPLAPFTLAEVRAIQENSGEDSQVARLCATVEDLAFVADYLSKAAETATKTIRGQARLIEDLSGAPAVDLRGMPYEKKWQVALDLIQAGEVRPIAVAPVYAGKEPLPFVWVAMPASMLKTVIEEDGDGTVR